jgi:hypothetical protein
VKCKVCSKEFQALVFGHLSIIYKEEPNLSIRKAGLICNLVSNSQFKLLQQEGKEIPLSEAQMWQQMLLNANYLVLIVQDIR